jgi:hypothetical protein
MAVDYRAGQGALSDVGLGRRNFGQAHRKWTLKRLPLAMRMGQCRSNSTSRRRLRNDHDPFRRPLTIVGPAPARLPANCQRGSDRDESRRDEGRRHAVDRRTELANEIKSELKLYLPEALQILDHDITTALAADLLVQWPTLAELQKVSPGKLRKFFYLGGDRLF